MHSHLVQRESSRRKELEHTRFDEDYEIRIRGLWLLHELGEPITVEELIPLFNSKYDEAIIGAALLMSEVNGEITLQKLINGIPCIVTRLLEEDNKRAKGIAELEGWDEYLPDHRDAMTVLWAIALALSRQGQKAIKLIQIKMIEIIKNNRLDEYQLIHTIPTLGLALYLIGKQGIDTYNKIKNQTTKETFVYYDECFYPIDLKGFKTTLDQILARNPLYARWAKYALETVEFPKEKE